MQITAFTIDVSNKTVNVMGQDDHGTYVNVGAIKLHGHETKTVHELEKHAREEVRRVLRELAQEI